MNPTRPNVPGLPCNDGWHFNRSSGLRCPACGACPLDLIRTSDELDTALAPVLAALTSESSMDEVELVRLRNAAELAYDRLTLSHRGNRPRASNAQMSTLCGKRARDLSGPTRDAVARLYSVLI